MKYRMDFVTNSSSSSFICEICGNEETGWDLSLSDAKMCECESEHIFCLDERMHISISDFKDYMSRKKSVDISEFDDSSEEELIEMANEEGIGIPKEMCPICSFKYYSESDMCQYLLKENNLKRMDVIKKIQESVKSRRNISDGEIILYICTKLWLRTEDIIESWKTGFEDYDEFQKYIRATIWR